jgi:hypothetical protein
MGAFEDLLKSRSITMEQVLRKSKILERRSPKDRELATKRRAARAQKQGYDNPRIEKPRSGRPVTGKQFKDALADRPIARLQRQKLLRAVNAILKARELETVDAEHLFRDVRRKKGKAKATAR